MMNNDINTILLDIDSIKEVTIISDKEVEILTSVFQSITKKKKEYLVKEGSLSSNLYFIVKVETPDIVYHLRRIELSTLKTNAKA